MYRIRKDGAVIRISDGAYVPADPENWVYQDYLAWVAAGNVPEHEADAPVAPDDLVAMVTAMVQARLDAFAQTRGYDGILSACSYASSGVPRFQGDAEYCVSARDATWAALYALHEQVVAGSRPQPTMEEVLTMLPELAWPT